MSHTDRVMVLVLYRTQSYSSILGVLALSPSQFLAGFLVGTAMGHLPRLQGLADMRWTLNWLELPLNRVNVSSPAFHFDLNTYIHDF